FSTGQLDIEAILRARPDLIIARIDVRPTIENTVLYSVLERLGIPLLYVDSEVDPLVNVPRSVELLGDALGQSEHAAQFTADYRERLAELQVRSRALPPRRVFVEVRAGQAGNFECCHTQGKTGWGLMVEALGAVNIGSRYLRGRSASVALETLIRGKPDLYVMTGTQRVRNGVSAIPFGYRVDREQVERQMLQLMRRPGFAAVVEPSRGCVAGLHHQFYNSVFNLIGLEYLAKAIWPEAFTDLDPDARYREMLGRFTTLPADQLFVFASTTCL
ncbi:MAG: Periplasmic binding protein, partial [Pseudomonas sp.]|nr:Periplasmic binding protein [Pseudomonas sp.]